MAAKFFLVLLLAVAANAMPKLTPRLKEEIAAEKVSSLLMPGPVLMPGNVSVEVEKLDASPECVLCEYVMDKLDQMLAQNATEQEIKEALDKVCSLLPSTISTECKQFVDEYADLILKYLSQGLDPKLVCTEIGLCKGSNVIQGRPVDPNVVIDINDIGDSSECETCQMIAKEIENLITQNSTQQEIEEVLKQVCNILPAEIKTQCDQFVETYLPEILNLLALEVSPDMICKELGLCTTLKVVDIEDVRVEPIPPNPSNLTCDFCLKIIGFAKELAANNDTVADVERLLKLVCYYMLPVIKECKDFIDDVIPKIFDELSKLDADAICKQLKMCPSSSTLNDVRCFMTNSKRCFQP